MKTWQKIAIAVVITFFVAFSAGVVTGVGLSQSGKITKAPSTDPVTTVPTMPSVTTTTVTPEVIFVPPPTTVVTILPGTTNGTPGITFPPLMDIKFDIEAGKALGVIMIGSPPQIELLSGNEKVKIAWGVRNVSSNETGPFKIKFLVNGKQSGDVINVESLAVGKTYDYEVQLVLPKDSKTEITVTVSSE